MHSLTVASLLLLASKTALASPCLAFDIHWNLLAFGLDGKDWNAGTQDTWASGKATDMTKSGRPPFDGTNTTCYLSQFTNAIYVLNGDASSPTSVHIYDASASSWSTQSTSSSPASSNPFAAILDHDTNVFYAVAPTPSTSTSSLSIFSLEMEDLKSASDGAREWKAAQEISFDTTGYSPVMALAQNHVHFLNVPGDSKGTARIFVIHFSFMQVEPQSYGDFPATHGKTTSFFKDSGVQTQFAFIPDDGSATYVLDVTTNTTQALPGPSTKDSSATYFASVDSLVQLTSSGSVSYLPYNPSDTSANSKAQWSVVQALAAAAPASQIAGPAASGSAGANATGSKTSASAGASQTGSENGNSALSYATGMKSAMFWSVAVCVGMGVVGSIL